MRPGIPEEICANDVLKVLEMIGRNGIPPKRESTKFDLIHNNRRYPPKYVISIATKIATGKELPPNFFLAAKKQILF